MAPRGPLWPLLAWHALQAVAASASASACPRVEIASAQANWEAISEQAVEAGAEASGPVSLWAALNMCEGGACKSEDCVRDSPDMNYFISDWVLFDTGAPIDELNSQYDGALLAGDYVTRPSESDESVFVRGYSKVTEALLSGAVNVNVGGADLDDVDVQAGDSVALDVTFNSPVSAISASGSQHEVATSGGNYTCDHVIVTLPLGVLKMGTVVFEPPLSEDKRSAIAGLGVGSVEKFAMLFDEVFWDGNFTYYNVGSSVQKGLFFKFVNLNQVVERPVLMTVAAGAASAVFVGMTDAEAWDAARAQLVSIFGDDVVPQQPRAMWRTAWQSDEFSRGTYTFNTVSSTVRMWENISQSEGDNLHFAGEHTTKKYRGTVHGAFAEGQRAARAVLQAVGSSSASVCIVGAGVAGLAAARTLKDNPGAASLTLTILEARTRVGGRVWTDYTEAGFDTNVGHEVEKGAGWIHSDSARHPVTKINSILQEKTVATSVKGVNIERLHVCNPVCSKIFGGDADSGVRPASIGARALPMVAAFVGPWGFL